MGVRYTIVALRFFFFSLKILERIKRSDQEANILNCKLELLIEGLAKSVV